MENRTNSNISHQIPARVIEADSSLARDIRLKRLRMIDTLVAKTCTPCRRGIPPLTTQEAEHDQRKVRKPRRVGRDERRHGIEHQKDRKSCSAMRCARASSAADSDRDDSNCQEADYRLDSTDDRVLLTATAKS
jgi:hypothetical protein